MASIRSKSFAEPDEVRQFANMESQLVNVGAISVGRAILQPGWRWSTSIGSVTGEVSCHVHHMNLIVSGRIRFEMSDGEVGEFGANTVVVVPPGHDAAVVGDEPVVLVDLYGNAADVGRRVDHQRVVTTILMSDIADSTATAARLGDARWRQLLAEHDRLVRTRFERFAGQEVNTTGDGFIATFASAVSALRCATAIRDGVAALGLSVRVGVHTGEVEQVDNDVRGLTVHAAARIMSLAGPSEVLASDLTRNLVEGSGLQFEERGQHDVKGFERPIHVLALTD